MLDTGATVSILSEETWRKSGVAPNLKPVVGTLTTADGSEITVLGEASVRLRMGHIDVPWPMVIARGLTHDCLLGSDFFQSNGCQIKYDTGTFLVGGAEVPIHYRKEKPSVCRVLLTATAEIEPGTERVLGARLEHGFERNSGSPGIVEGVPASAGGKIGVARSLVVPKGTDVLVRLANFSDDPIKLPANSLLGQYHPLNSDGGEVMLIDVASQLQAPSCDRVKMGEGVHKPEVERQGAEERFDGRSTISLDSRDLSKEQQGQFFSLVDEFADVFAVNNSDLGKTELLEHEINTAEAAPIKQPPRRVPPYKRDVIDQQLDDLLAHGRIEQSQSPWSSPVVLARKHDGTYRMCIDYRRLNQCTVRDAQPLPRTDDVLEALGGACWFSCLDLASGYWQVPVAERDRTKTAFVTHRGQFQWSVMPFGLTNGPATFQRLMNLALDGLTWTYCLVYLDDVIIWSATFEDHLHRLRQVFEKIRMAKLKLKPSKCQFLKTQVKFLGHVVSSQGIKTDPEKVESVKTWPTPADVKELQGFLGLASYYRRFISDFSIIAEPLNKLCRKGVPFHWLQEQQSAFEELKHRLTSAPVLAYPDFSPGVGSFILDTDASQQLGLGAVLSQSQQDGTERVIAYASRSLNDHEKNYCTTRLEMLALVTYVDYFRYYLLGRRFRLRTDHHSLTWLMTFKEPQGQVARWLERLQEYNFEVEHRAGRSHGNADAMSRKPRRYHGDCPSCGQLPKPQSQVSTVDSSAQKRSEISWAADGIVEAQLEDPDVGLVLRWLSQNKVKPTKQELQPMSHTTRAVWAQFELLQLQDGVLVLKDAKDRQGYRNRTVLPSKLIKPAIKELHDGVAGGHLGRMKTLRKMKTRFWRPGMTKEVHRYCDNCLTCAQCKSKPRPRAPLQSIPSGNPMQRVHIDIVGPLPRTKKGNCYILTAECSFTKWVEAWAIPNQRASTCAKTLVRHWICRFGVPDSIHSDQGRNFESKVFEEMCHLLQMHKSRSTAYHPEGNGQVENFHKTLKAMLKARVEGNPKGWDEQLDFAMMAYRSSVHSSTGHTPFEMMFGREMRVPLDVMMGGANENPGSCTEFVEELRENLEGAHRDARQTLKVAQRRQKDAYDKGVKHTVYQAGDLVLRYTPQLKPGEAGKFHRQWQGPFRIVKQVTKVTYLVKKVGGRSRRSKVVHFNNLRLYRRRPEEGGESATAEVTRKPDEMRETSTADGLMSHDGEEMEVAGSDSEQDSQDPEVPEDGEYQSCYTGGVQPGTADMDADSDHVDAQRDDVSPQEREYEETLPGSPTNSDGEAVEEQEATPQIQRPVRVRRPPDRYGEWVLNSLQQITTRLQLLEDKQTMERDRIRKLKPNCWRKQEHCEDTKTLFCFVDVCVDVWIGLLSYGSRYGC